MHEEQHTSKSLITTGYIVSLLPALILPIVFSPIAIIIGIINIARNEAGHGFLQIIIAVAAGLIGSHIGGPGLGLPRI